MSHFFYSNESIVSILLSSLYLLVVAIVANYQKKLNRFTKTIFGLLLFIGIYLLISTNGRAGWIGFIAGLFFLNKSIFLFSKAAPKSSLLALLFIPFLFVLLFWLKKDSSLGRLFIYKVSAGIFKDNWLWGIGFGKFKVQYNLYQAAYFSSHSIDSKEALLADNTFYGFNDVSQLLIEMGVIGFASLLITAILVVTHFRRYTVKSSKAHLYYGTLSAFICIMVASLFSYPFHVFGIQLIALVLLALMLFSIELQNTPAQKNKYILLYAKTICCGSILFLIFYGYNKMTLINKSAEAFDLSRTGFKNQSLKIYKALSESYNKDGPTLFSYGKQLYYSNQLTTAYSILQETKKYYTDNEVYKLSASISYELGDIKQAEEDYKTALYMVPNRMISRYELFTFYLTIKDTANAIYWGHSILQMPVKVPSVTTENLQTQTKIILQKLDK